MNTVRRALASHAFRDLDAPHLAANMLAVVATIPGNTNVTPADVAKLPYTEAQITAGAGAITTAHTARLNTPSPLNTKAEQTACNTGMEIMLQTAGWAEGVANRGGNYELAVPILLSLGFQPRKEQGPRADPGFVLSSPLKTELDIHVPTSDAGTTRVARVSTDGGKTYSGSLIIHGKVLNIFGFVSGTNVFVQHAVSTPPPKRANVRLALGSDGLSWSDAATCVIS
jgi:hypothetical protein